MDDTDRGEPLELGRRDLARLKVRRQDDNIVLTTTSMLVGGLVLVVDNRVFKEWSGTDLTCNSSEDAHEGVEVFVVLAVVHGMDGLNN